MPINLATAAFGGVVGTILGAGITAGVAAWRGEPITLRDVAAGAARGAATGTIGGLTFGLGLIPAALGGATGGAVGEYLASMIGRTPVSRRNVAVSAVTGLVGGALLSHLAPAPSLFAPPIRATVASAAVSGAGAGTAGQLAGNLLDDRPILEGVPTAAAIGAGSGALVGGAARAVQELAHARPRVEPGRPARPAEPRPAPAPAETLETIVTRNALRNLEARGTPEALRVLQALRDGRLVLHVNERPAVGLPQHPNHVYIAVPYDSTQADSLRSVLKAGLEKLVFQEQLAALGKLPRPASKGMIAALGGGPGSGGGSATPRVPQFEDFVRSGVFEGLEHQGSPLAARIWKALADGRLVLRVNRDAAAVAAAKPNEIDIDIPYHSNLDNTKITLGRVLALAGPKLDALEAAVLR